MSNTEGRWTQTGYSQDMRIFLGASELKDTAGLATTAWAVGPPALFSLHTAGASSFVLNLEDIMRKIGEPVDTGGITGTPDPLGLGGIPPIPSSKLPTLVGPTSGFTKKGMMITGIDVIYKVAVALTVATVGIVETKFVNNAAPVTTNILAVAANGLPTAVQAQPYVFHVNVVNPAFITDPDASVILVLNMTGTVDLYGVELYLGYNFN